MSQNWLRLVNAELVGLCKFAGAAAVDHVTQENEMPSSLVSCDRHTTLNPFHT